MRHSMILHGAIVALVVTVITGAWAMSAVAQASPSPVATPASSAGGVIPPTTGAAVCDPFLTATEVSVVIGPATLEQGVNFQDQNPPLQHIACSWRPTTGPQLNLELSDLLLGISGDHFLIEKYGDNIGGTGVPGLGDKAYTGTQYPGDYVARAVTVGELDRTLVLWGDTTPIEQLLAIAHTVRAATTPGVEVQPSAGPVSGAIVGDWQLTDPDTSHPRVTVHFGADGVEVLTVQ